MGNCVQRFFSDKSFARTGLHLAPSASLRQFSTYTNRFIGWAYGGHENVTLDVYPCDYRGCWVRVGR